MGYLPQPAHLQESGQGRGATKVMAHVLSFSGLFAPVDGLYLDQTLCTADLRHGSALLNLHVNIKTVYVLWRWYAGNSK